MDADVQFAGFDTAVTIVGALLIFYTYYYFAHSRTIEQRINRNITGTHADVFLFFFRKLSGFFILGVIPGIIYFSLIDSSGVKFGLTLNHLVSNFLLIAGLIFLTAIVLFFHFRKNPEKNTLQLKPSGWNVPMFMLNGLGWSLYLIGYEFLFRGILLFECYEKLGFWPAIAVNVSVYSAIHMVNGKDQAIGALLFGTVACYFALTRETLLIPVFMHLSLSILSDYYSLRIKHSLNLAGKNELNMK